MSIFQNCAKLETVMVEEDTKGFSEASEMFKGCTNLKTVNLPSSFLYLGEYMFEECTSLEEITLYGTDIPLGTFEDCTSLKKVNASRVSIVEDNAFQNCKSLTNISFSNLDRYSKIGIKAFSGCQKLTNINFGKVIKTEECAFENCTSLEKIVIPRKLTTICNYAFCGCKNLTDVTYEGNQDPGKEKLCIFRNCEKFKRIKLTSN